MKNKILPIVTAMLLLATFAMMPTPTEAGPGVLETVTILPDGDSHCSEESLHDGWVYLIEVQGTYVYWPTQLPDHGYADAEYANRPSGSYGGPGWVLGEANYPPAYPADSLDVRIDGDSVDWGSYNDDHMYFNMYTGSGASVCFSIYDSAYGDNSGSLTATIYVSGQLPLIPDWHTIETVTLDSQSSSETYSTSTLEDGRTYQLKASGTWANGNTRIVDARYYSDDTWTSYGDEPYSGADPKQIEMVVDGSHIDWGSYNSDHVYYHTYTGDGTTVSFLIWELYTSWYNDNSGSLTVEIQAKENQGKVKYKFLDQRDKLISTLILEDAPSDRDYDAYFGDVSLGVLSTDANGDGAVHKNLQLDTGTYTEQYVLKDSSDNVVWHSIAVTITVT